MDVYDHTFGTIAIGMEVYLILYIWRTLATSREPLELWTWIVIYTVNIAIVMIAVFFEVDKTNILETSRNLMASSSCVVQRSPAIIIFLVHNRPSGLQCISGVWMTIATCIVQESTSANSSLVHTSSFPNQLQRSMHLWTDYQCAPKTDHTHKRGGSQSGVVVVRAYQSCRMHHTARYQYPPQPFLIGNLNQQTKMWSILVWSKIILRYWHFSI